MKLRFIGATDDVTGSMTILETAKGKILIDCGLYQGKNEVVKKNLRSLPFNPKEIIAIILTHAHLDHCGNIPHLVKLGFRGNIYGTKATLKLARIIMEDSANILEKSENHILGSYYSSEDVIISKSLFKTKKNYEPFNVMDLTINFQSAGHILGASSILIQGDKKIVFSGDLGRFNDPLIPPPDMCPEADILVLESTYGDKNRHGKLEEELVNFIKKIKIESRIGIIASFAVARAQLLITLIYNYFKNNPNEKFRFVIDGPMMTKANKIYKEFSNETKLSLELNEALSNVDIIDHPRKWESLKKCKGPLLVVTSSGMVSGGRIWRYLENWQHNPNASLFLPGYQSLGTPGRALKEGEKNIHDGNGNIIRWSGEVITSEAFSSHADQAELIYWIKGINKSTQIYLNHGEEKSKKVLAKKLLELCYVNVNIATNLNNRRN